MRIGLLKYREFHDPILRPAFEALRKDHNCLLTSSEAELIKHCPEVVIMAEAVAGRLRQQMPCALFIHTRHGLASKGHAYKGANESDYLCVTSPAMKDWYLKNNAHPRRDFWVIGYLQMDPIFRGIELPLPDGMRVDPDRKVVLFAPTCTVQMSAAPMLGERFVERIRGSRQDVSIIIKPHPLIAKQNPQWIEWWRAAAAIDPHVHLLQDLNADIMPFLQRADLLISDASSVMLEYLALDRPMVLLSNPARTSCKEYDVRGYEWTWRDMGEDIEDPDQLASAVNRALDNPTERAAQRARYREQLFGQYTDGRAFERLTAHVDGLRSVVPRVRTAYTLQWPLRKIGGATRRVKRFLTGSNGSAPVPPQSSEREIVA